MSGDVFHKLAEQSVISFNQHYQFKKQEKTNVSSFSGYFLCNRTLIIILANLIGILAFVGIGLVIGLAINSTTPKTFGSLCKTTSDCKNLSSYGLVCNNNNCTCSDSAYFDGTTCSVLKDYQYPCKSDSECNKKQILSCVLTNNGYQCGCTTSRFWTGQFCKSLLTKLSNCTSNSECQQSLGLTCNGTCVCSSTSYWNGVTCETFKIYNQSCFSNISCDATKSLYCIESGQNPGTCICDNLLYWDSTSSSCIQQKTINSSCTQTSQCRTDFGLSCTASNICSCDNGYYWSGSSCVQMPSYGSACSLTIPCDTTLLLSCVSNKCQCSSTDYWSGIFCTAKLSIGASCTSPDQCSDPLGLNCSSSFCACSSNYYWDSTKLSCVAQMVNGGICNSTVQCRTDKLLECIGYKCSCNSSYYYDGTSCVTKKSYQVSCSSSSECNDNVLLSCPTSSGQCDCPKTSTAYKCDCPNGYFWDFNDLECYPQKTYGETCVSGANYQCIGGLGLSCTGTCSCSTKYYWDGVKCSCMTATSSSTTTQYGYAVSGSTSFNVDVADLSSMTVYSGSFVYALEFKFLTGSTLTYGNINSGSITSINKISLVNKKVTALYMRSGSWIDSFKFQLYDTTTKTYSVTPQMGGNGGGATTLDLTTIASNSIYFEITKFQGSIDSNYLRTWIVGSTYIQCI